MEDYRNAAQDGGSHKIAVLISFDVDVSAVQQQLGALVDAALDQGLHAGLGLGRDERAHVRAGLIAFNIIRR